MRRLAEITEDADRRLADAQAELEATRARAALVTKVTDASDRLKRHNSIGMLVRQGLVDAAERRRREHPAGS